MKGLRVPISVHLLYVFEIYLNSNKFGDAALRWLFQINKEKFVSERYYG